MDSGKIAEFLVKAKRATYAGHGDELKSSRKSSHDLDYQEGDLYYYDTYVGGDRFSGEEAVWENGMPIWAMNYTGRVIGSPFSGDFLKEALAAVSEDMPYRGPENYVKDCYSYYCKVTGDFEWFQGYEEIFFRDRLIYDCYFHGGVVK